jgi:hypothetical protein
MDFRKIEKIVQEELHSAELRILARIKNDNLLTSDNLSPALTVQAIPVSVTEKPKKLPDN